MRILGSTRTRILKEFGRICPVCGREDVNLHLCHIVPLSMGGTADESNLVVMCATCHELFDRSEPREIEFIDYLSGLIEEHPNYQHTKSDVRIRTDLPYRIDIQTDEEVDDGVRSLMIECKRSSFISRGQVTEAVAQLKRYSAVTPADAYILAFPGRLRPELSDLLRRETIEVWDADFIAKKFRKQIEASWHPYFAALFLSIRPLDQQSPEKRLLEKLRACRPGIDDWGDYQRVIGQIFKHLFCPPLEVPYAESSDATGVNRRDLIFPNYVDRGFWSFLRQAYRADYIVIDAKNYKKAIGKREVLQIANYLKPRGAGMFAVIASRRGAGPAGLATIREQWMGNGKMIVALQDEHVEEMLMGASTGGNATEVIGRLVEEFRLSM